MTRVAQLGRWRGWLQVDGRRHALEPASWRGQRDHSWGIRTPMSNDETRPPVVAPRHFFWTWAMCQFGELGLSFFFKEREPGKPWYLSGAEFRRGADGVVQQREITAVRHDYHWADDTLGQSMAQAEFELEFDHGPPRSLRLDACAARYCLKTGLYGGFKGWNHGDDRGEYHSECDVWNLDDAATRLAARTLSDHVVRTQRFPAL